jgi:hypothetical protein
MLTREQVVGHDLVYGELFIGDIGGRTKFLSFYDQLSRVAPVAHDDAVTFTRHHRLHGRGAGWADIHVLAAAMAARIPLWTSDPRLHAIARELGAAYNPKAH